MLAPHKDDVLSGFFVFLIALPLCMGIAMASGFPPIAGIITAIVGGCVASFMGSSRLTIKGPAAGLIIIAIAAVQELGMGDPVLGYKRCLAVGVVAALIQIIFAAKRLGTLSEFMPPSVVHGMLAAIGLIIMAKQIHLLLGVTPHAKETMGLLVEIPDSIRHLNPEVFAIGGFSLALLVILPRLPKAWSKKLPAPLIAILLAIPFSIYFDFDHRHQYTIFGTVYSVGPKFLIDLPGNPLAALTFPDFSVIYSLASIKYIIMFALIGSVESLLTVTAVDSLDPKGQHSDLNKDLMAVGIGNLLASLAGGLPMISEIVRSKTNIDSGAQTHWSNVFHGLFLLLFVSFAPGLLHLIPLAVLSAMLIYTGYRLASPRAFIDTYHHGKDQLLLFATTFVITIMSDLLIGVAAGILLKVLLHLSRGVSPKNLFKSTTHNKKIGGQNVINVDGPSLFTNYLALRKEIQGLQDDPDPIVINFKRSPIIDLTVQTKLKTLQREFGEDRLIITGLDLHRSLSDYDKSTKVL